MKNASEIKIGDKLKAGNMISEVVDVKLVVEGYSTAQGKSEGRKIKYIKVEGQPEIADHNLQQYIDQGSIEII